MTICVDANVLIALIDPLDVFHLAASEAVIGAGSAITTNVTRGEALILPTRTGQAEVALDVLAEFGVASVPVDDDIVAEAVRLRADHGNRSFPMLDALVVALGVERSVEVLTCDAKWPEIPAADVRVLQV